MRHQPFLIIETPIGIFSKIWNTINDFDTITHQYKTLNTANEKNEGVYFEDFEWTVNCFKPHELLKTAQLLLKTAQKLWLEVGGDLVIAPFLLGPQQKCSIPRRSQRKMLQHGAPPQKTLLLSMVQILPYKIALFWVFWKLSKLAILIDEFLQESSTYRKNKVYHDDGKGKSNKSVISDFRFLNFRYRDFLI